jgi:hypothetical protein
LLRLSKHPFRAPAHRRAKNGDTAIAFDAMTATYDLHARLRGSSGSALLLTFSADFADGKEF